MNKTLITATSRGVVTLSKAPRGDTTLFEARLGKEGIIELVPQRVGPASQAWFWTERWQRMEREVDDEIVARRVKRFECAETLFEALDED